MFLFAIERYRSPVRFFQTALHVLHHPSLISYSYSYHHGFHCRIREVADKINKYGTQTFPALQSLKVPVKQVVVGNSYLGVLLADGRAFRVAYSVIAERLDLSKHDSSSKM